jgi:hypothetical protein
MSSHPSGESRGSQLHPATLLADRPTAPPLSHRAQRKPVLLDRRQPGHHHRLGYRLDDILGLDTIGRAANAREDSASMGSRHTSTKPDALHSAERSACVDEG